LEGIGNPRIVWILGEESDALVEEGVELEKMILRVPTLKRAKAVVCLSKAVCVERK